MKTTTKKLAFDVITKNSQGKEVRLGRTWLNNKEGKYSLSFDLNSLPMGDSKVVLKSTEEFSEDDCPRAFYLKMPVERGEDKKTYWHQVGRVQIRPGDKEYPFDLKFESMPTSGNLVAFDAIANNKSEAPKEVPF